MKSKIVPASAITAALVLTGCAGPSGGGGPDDVADDGVFRIALAGDPGSLDPQSGVTSTLGQMNRFLYDSLVNTLDGEVVSGLAEEWTETDNTIVFTLHDGITCADGSPLTASDVAANITYVGDASKASPMGGFAFPLGTTATADDAERTVTMTTPETTGFLLNTLSLFPIVCATGMADRASLDATPAGTGPYTLGAAVAGSSYTLERRDDYAWGPDGAGTDAPGIPKTIEVSVSANATTTANQLLGGELNAGTVFGPDADRLEGAGLHSSPLDAIIGEIIYNQNPGRPTADAEVRRALTQALDLTALTEVAGAGSAQASPALTGLNLCESDLTALLPDQDVDAAHNALAGADLPELTVAYFDLGAASVATAELVVSQLGEVGVSAKAVAVSFTDLNTVLFQNAEFDIALLPLDGTTPTSIQPQVSGPTNPNGGQNFANIANAEYDTLSAQAKAMPGTTGCELWNQADVALVEGADIIPFATDDYPVWAARAEFTTYFGTVLPTTIRMLG
ncbi:ABC transporter substrate-binding protein [Microbacterium aerolatum]|uniref:ABC transporter substrate-binding protein n=1 Tax=Microbacterium aerolatum TaxID=153731 RepID=UPI00384D0BB4